MLAHAAGRQRIGRDAAGLGVDRPARGQRLGSVGESSGSTPTTLTFPAYQAAMPPISPPPPTATRSVSRVAPCSSISRPIVPWPSSVSG
jgi:hypothetical protein